MAPSDRFQPRKQPKAGSGGADPTADTGLGSSLFSPRTAMPPGRPTASLSTPSCRSGSLYQYFPNKDSILHALMDAHVDAGAKLLGDRLSAVCQNTSTTRCASSSGQPSINHRDNPRLHQVLFEEAPRAPAFLSRLHALEETVQRRDRRRPAGRTPGRCMPAAGSAPAGRGHHRFACSPSSIASPAPRTGNTGEIVYWGTGSAATPGAALDLWMESPAHRAIILNCAFTAGWLCYRPGTATR